MPFTGTEEERIANRATHTWVDVPNPIQKVPLPASWVEQVTQEEAAYLAKPLREIVPWCSRCGTYGYSTAYHAADWKCGEAPRYTKTVF